MLLKQSPIVANSKIKLPVGCIIHVRERDEKSGWWTKLQWMS